MLLRNVNKLDTFHRQNVFQATYQIFRRFSIMDSCNYINLFIKMLKHNIDALFPSYKPFWLRNDGDLVMS